MRKQIFQKLMTNLGENLIEFILLFAVGRLLGYEKVKVVERIPIL